jgi:uncharacterized repeat protein (TIGR03803 family)
MKTQRHQRHHRKIPTIFITLSLALLWGAPLASGQTFQYWPLPAGSYSYDAVVQGSDGYFYGTTYNGGLNGVGEVFKFDSNGNYTPVWDFSGGAGDGASPGGPLMKAADGNLYGVTVLGGAGGHGALYKVDGSGTYTNVGFMSGAIGSNPYGGLVQGTDGYLYGVSFHGGIFPGPDGGGYGTVYRTDTTFSNLTAMLQFSGTNALSLPDSNPGLADGENPYYCDLIQATNGYFYGTTYQGGSNNMGTVFKMDANGVTTTLVDFNGGANGGNPFSGLMQAKDGNLYGTTISGGAGYGTIYRIGMDDSFSVLVTMSGSVNTIWAKLMQASDGLLYGTSSAGGSSSVGQVFAMDYAGNMTTAASFNYYGGYYPRNPVTQGADGNFYGLAVFTIGGSGSFWKLTPTAPMLSSARCPLTNPSQVTVVFSQSVRANTGTNLANYSVNHGGPVVSVVRNSATTVTLQLTYPLDVANVNTLTVNNVQSVVGAVPIAANSQVTILVPSTPVRAQFNVDGTNFVVLEAEDYNLNTPNGSRSWVFTNSPVLLSLTDANITYSGTGAMQGETGIGSTVGLGTGIGSAVSGPRLDYMVMFNTASTNYVWVRGVGNSDPGTGGADSVSIGVDGGLTTRIIGFPQGQGYWWTNGIVTTNASTNIVITTLGLHVINVWIRETGFAIDKLLLADSSSYAPPADLGPAESPIYRSTLTITRSGTQDILSWLGGGTLQSSTNVSGIYQTVLGASSPFTVTPTNQANFYRVKQ